LYEAKQKTVELNGKTYDGFFVSVSNEDIKPLVVTEAPKE
jgi:hypothetical protein